MALKWFQSALGAGLLLALPLSLLAAVQPAKPAGGWDEKKLFSQSEDIPRLLAEKKIEPQQIPNPHWREDSCAACHRGAAVEGNAPLRSKDINQLCNNCHETISAGNYIHAVGMVPSTEKRNRMPEPFQQAVKRGGGVITCIACHDLPMQCLKKRFGERDLNPLFFRGGPFKARTDLCFNCHNPTHYERLNPHDQITDEGELDQRRCLVCHSMAPNRREVKSIDDVQFNVADDLATLCTGCHPWRPHPGGGWASYAKGSDASGPNHLVVPPDAILKRIKETEKQRDVIVPLEPKTGRIFCATCHNPHERGVQRYDKADRGADGPKRLRRTGGMPICLNCHDK
ncbi:MAG: cytochrome c3 family protein [Pseudomonadota bacterium]